MNIASSVCAASRASNGREANKHGSLLALLSQKGRRSNVAKVTVAGKGSMSTGAPSMNGSLGNLRCK
jgi:hypothetical protein